MLVFKILKAAIYLIFVLGMGAVVVDVTHDMMLAAFTAHQKGPISYSKFNRQLWGPQQGLLKAQPISKGPEVLRAFFIWSPR